MNQKEARGTTREKISDMTYRRHVFGKKLVEKNLEPISVFLMRSQEATFEEG